MPDRRPDTEMRTSRFYVQGGPMRDGVKCNRHTITDEYCLHLHDFYEIELVVSGELSQSVNGVPLTFPDGGFVFMDLFSAQRIARPHAPCDVWTLSISPSEAAPALTGLLTRTKFPLVGTLPKEALSVFCETALALQKAMKEDTPYTRDRVSALTVLLCTQLFTYGEVPDTPGEEPRAYHYIQKALLFINENFAAPLTLSEVAGHIHISSCYLSDLFSRIVGCRFIEYLTRLRLERAQSMLRPEGSSVSEVATACGFGTVSNFTRAFRRTFGVAPSVWRRDNM